MKLLPQGAAEYRTGEILWEGRDLLPLSESEMNGFVAAIWYDFSDPMTSLIRFSPLEPSFVKGLPSIRNCPNRSSGQGL